MELCRVFSEVSCNLPCGISTFANVGIDLVCSAGVNISLLMIKYKQIQGIHTQCVIYSFPPPPPTILINCRWFQQHFFGKDTSTLYRAARYIYIKYDSVYIVVYQEHVDTLIELIFKLRDQSTMGKVGLALGQMFNLIPNCSCPFIPCWEL